MPMKYSGDNLTFPDNSVQTTAPSGFGFKNRIINGGMMIDQRNAGASIATIANNIVYTLDRFAYYATAAAKFTIQQNAGSVTPPAGFTNYMGVTVGASANVTVGSTDGYILLQFIEGYNVADLAYGTASASPVTVSFWVRSSVTGTFGASLRNWNASKSYPFSYTINSANTWEQKSVTITGDIATALGNITNGPALGLVFSLGVGSSLSSSAGSWQSGAYNSTTGAVKLIETNSATFYITGVQLEKGSTATSFDYRPYGTELALCQRYYFKNKADNANAPLGGVGPFGASNTLVANFQYPVPMRSAPTATQSGCSNSNGVTGSAITSITTSYYGNSTATVQFVSGASFAASQGGYVYGPTTSAYVDFSAEL